MSSSVEASKISLVDDKETVEKKIKSADFVSGDSNNGIMAFFENIVFVLKGDKKEKLIIERPEKFGGNLEFENYDELKKAIEEKSVHPLDVKLSAANEINNLLSGISKKKDSLEDLFKKAYPSRE